MAAFASWLVNDLLTHFNSILYRGATGDKSERFDVYLDQRIKGFFPLLCKKLLN